MIIKTVTDDHKVLTQKGWKEIKNVKSDDIIKGRKSLEGTLDDQIDSFKIIKILEPK